MPGSPPAVLRRPAHAGSPTATHAPGWTLDLRRADGSRGRAAVVRTLVVLTLLALPVALSAQDAAQPIGQAEAGPVIDPYGAVFEVEGMEVPVDTSRRYKVLFDVALSPEGPEGVNRNLNTVARYLNMHVKAGVPLENMSVAVVLHGPAAKDALRPEPYRERYDAENPNVDLIRQLGRAGVQFYMCGQSAMGRGMSDEMLLPEIQMALSAMTARATLQAQGFESIR